MKRCTKCFEIREMFHGRCCKECRQKYLHFMQRERSKKNCPVCRIEHHENCLECSTKCKILNRYKIVNDCWEWQGKINESGYGVLNIREEGKKLDVLVHRESFRLLRSEIPDGLCVLHKCDNPACINPDHLWLGTNKENTQDCVKKGRFCNGHLRSKASGKITEDQVREIRELYKNGSSQKDIQEKFKLSQSQVSGIVTYRFWKYVT